MRVTSKHVGKTVLMYGRYHVTVLEVRAVTGGTAVTVRRASTAPEWPWTVTSFTTCSTHLKELV